MKLDRNINRGGRGKYALVNMRKLIPVIDAHEPKRVTETKPSGAQIEIYAAFNLLLSAGIITLGNETPGDQFFVMKYKDKFTHEGLMAYADAVKATAKRMQFEAGKLSGEKRDQLQQQAIELDEYHKQMCAEANAAFELGNRIPN